MVHHFEGMTKMNLSDYLSEKLDYIDKTAMNGIETIEVAINCMHHKASNYVVKSETTFIRLQKIINWHMERM